MEIIIIFFFEIARREIIYHNNPIKGYKIKEKFMHQNSKSYITREQHMKLVHKMERNKKRNTRLKLVRFHPHKVSMGFRVGSKGTSDSSCVGLQHKLVQETSSCQRHMKQHSSNTKVFT